MSAPDRRDEETPEAQRAYLLNLRWSSLRKLVELRAPSGIIAMAAQNYLGTVEGSEWCAIRRWFFWRVRLLFAGSWDTLCMRFCIHVLRMSRERAADLVFGKDQGDD